MARSKPAAELLVGKTLAGYRIIQLLGSGGTGNVYLAERAGSVPATARVALKVLRTELRSRSALVSRFEREAVAAARVDHPNVLRVLDVQREGDSVVSFAMELLVGLDLADTLAYSRSLSSPRAVRIAIAAARGLAAAHAAEVVHRDVKPENIFLVHAADGREVVKLLDFGFAHLPGDAPLLDDDASRHLVAGTPEYMAPEQAEGAPADPTADIYSLGVVLFEMLTGRVPYAGEYPEIADKHASDPVPSLRDFPSSRSATEALDAAVRRGLAKEPAERFPSMDAFADALIATLG